MFHSLKIPSVRKPHLAIAASSFNRKDLVLNVSHKNATLLKPLYQRSYMYKGPSMKPNKHFATKPISETQPVGLLCVIPESQRVVNLPLLLPLLIGFSTWMNMVPDLLLVDPSICFSAKMLHFFQQLPISIADENLTHIIAEGTSTDFDPLQLERSEIVNTEMYKSYCTNRKLVYAVMIGAIVLAVSLARSSGVDIE